jgi:hypothetical protein
VAEFAQVFHSNDILEIRVHSLVSFLLSYTVSAAMPPAMPGVADVADSGRATNIENTAMHSTWLRREAARRSSTLERLAKCCTATQPHNSTAIGLASVTIDYR